VIEAVAALDDRHGDVWLQTSSGWIQAQQVQPALIPSSHQTHHARIENQSLVVMNGEDEIARFALACPARMPAGEHRITQRTPGFDRADYSGIPWRLESNRGLILHGAYWHNQFACEHTGTSIEMSVIAAKSVYALLPEGSIITVA